MPYEAEWIIDNIRSHGYEAFIVGGCVRDAVLGRIPGDWDNKICPLIIIDFAKFG